MNLYQLSDEQMEIINSMENGGIDEDGIIDPVLQEMLTNNEKDWRNKVEAVALYIKQQEYDADAIRAEERALAERRKVKENKTASLRNYLSSCLRLVGQKKFETARTSISFRRSESVNIYDESAIPIEYHKVKTEYSKSGIKEDLKEGKEVPGAELVEKENIQIK